MPAQSRPQQRRRGRLFRGLAAFVILCAVAGYLVVQYITAGTGAPGCKVVSGRDDGVAYEFTPEQAVNAATITAVGTGRGLPERAVAIALATALQESGLRNITHGDRDSLGLFQQRPSQGWGTEKQIMDPTYAAGEFYKHLVKVDGYTKLPLTEAAQRVQRSGYPEAYAKHEPDATVLAAALTGTSAATLTCDGRSEATLAGGPEGVREALVRDFGGDALDTTAEEVGATEATPAPEATVSGRTVTVPVTGAAKGRSSQERGWQLAHWAVANASALHIERVTYAGREWTAGNSQSEWRAMSSGGTGGAEKGTGSLRILTAQ
ncbi:MULTISPECIES: heavy metal transporter [unclassified Streptomyces]|uniref:heavy metal transporter n=1 Tax=unclassified Streptomyces TaxID=2593676 RepID=UPI002258367D|nr:MULTISPECIES: heavy metal transporter [unclassified Streptomyces]MCX5331549.1 heavy metal transporter [Streptomyces sp. NBC_00140]MCX5360944.1 heavy metal transporter [Streptomyces sp. NBC_00124]